MSIENNLPDTSPTPPAWRDSTIMVDLSPLSLIRVSGTDALAFLNAQLTNDIRRLDQNHQLLAGWCSAKGRLLAIMRVVRHGEDYLLQLPATLREDIIKRLRIYVLRSKVTLQSADDEFVRIGIAGPQADAITRDYIGLLPTASNAVANIDRKTVIKLPGVASRYEVLVATTEAPALRTALSERALPCNYNVWRWHEIMAGLPTVLPETSEMFVPQTTNLDAVDGISFTKGCYPGQEIVARVHYRGRLKERMFLAHVKTEERLQPGDSIYAPDMPEQATGHVVDAAPSPDGGVDLLAVIHLSSAQAGVLHWKQPDGPRLKLGTLPYSIESPS